MKQTASRHGLGFLRQLNFFLAKLLKFFPIICSDICALLRYRTQIFPELRKNFRAPTVRVEPKRLMTFSALLFLFVRIISCMRSVVKKCAVGYKGFYFLKHTIDNRSPPGVIEEMNWVHRNHLETIFSPCQSYDIFISTYSGINDLVEEEMKRLYSGAAFRIEKFISDSLVMQPKHYLNLIDMINSSGVSYELAIFTRFDIYFHMNVFTAPFFDANSFNIAYHHPKGHANADDNLFIFDVRHFLYKFKNVVEFMYERNTRGKDQLLMHEIRPTLLMMYGIQSNAMVGVKNWSTDFCHSMEMCLFELVRLRT